jgi:hypothetical protein
MDTRRYLTALAVITVLGAPVVAFAHQQGMGSGGHPTGTQQAHTPGLHFGRDTNRWGPRPGFTQPETIADGMGGEVTIQCPCDLVRDPFKRHVVGGVPENQEFQLIPGVRDQREIDQGGQILGVNPSTVAGEITIMDVT